MTEMKQVYDRGVIKPGLKRMKTAMSALDDPENAVPAVHIAGTNGKGSTGSYMAGIFGRLGLKTGHYRTPAVLVPEEIISINGRNIPRDELDALKERVGAAYAQSGEGDELSKFETETACAFLYFAEQGCDISVIETGLGGDWDATNVIDNTAVCVFTPVSMDHMELLGHTLKEIAGHKAGIIKKGSLVVTSSQTPEVMKVLRHKALEEGAAFEVAEPLPFTVTPGMYGEHQRVNAGVAALACKRALELTGLSARFTEEETEAAVISGIENTKLFGCCTLLGTDPEMIADGAHNPGACRALAEFVGGRYKDRKKIYMAGFYSDKEYETCAGTVISDAEAVYTVTPPGSRGLDAEVLAESVYRATGIHAFPCRSIDEMMDRAEELYKRSKAAGDEPVIVAFGSLSWLAAAKEAYESRKDQTD